MGADTHVPDHDDATVRQSLIDASGAFVMQDKSLYAKQLRNPSDKKDYSLKALGGATQEERFDAIVEQLRKLPKAASVLMLGRYRSDLNLLSRNDRDGLFPNRRAYRRHLFRKNRTWTSNS